MEALLVTRHLVTLKSIIVNHYQKGHDKKPENEFFQKKVKLMILLFVLTSEAV